MTHDPGRERFLTRVGLAAGVIGGIAIHRAGFAGLLVWGILVVVIPTILALAGARTLPAFLSTGAALMASLYLQSVAFNIRSGYYEAYGVRRVDIVGGLLLWTATLGVAAAIAWATRRLTANHV